MKGAKMNKKKGFTLIETLIGIAITTGISLTAMKRYIEEAEDDKNESYAILTMMYQ